jgi:hypothetical protein
MTIENTSYPKVTEILKISDTSEGNGTYNLNIKVQFAEGEEPEQLEYFYRPEDPYGIAPQIRKWLSENPEAPVHVYVPPPAPTPEELRARMPALTARQFRLGFVQAGRSIASIDAAISAIPDPVEREKAEIEWDYADVFVRTHPLITQISVGLGMTDEQVDAMWEAAVNL